MKLWVDDIRPAPQGHFWAHSVNEAIKAIERADSIELIDIDHDAGYYASDSGDYKEKYDVQCRLHDFWNGLRAEDSRRDCRNEQKVITH